MGTNARLSVTYYDNIRKVEDTRFADIGMHPIHGAAKRDIGYSMAYNVAKEHYDHEDFKTIDYKVT